MLSADQKQYIITIFDLVYKVLTIIFGIIILKLYPFINEINGSLSKSKNRMIAKDVGHIFIGKVSGVITTSTDSILINALVGTVQTGLYSNYNIILGTLMSTLKQFNSAMRGSVGNLIATESPEHIHKVFKRLLFIMFFLASFCACCLTGLIDPFINIAFGEGLLLGRATVFICIFNLYMSTIDIPIWNFVAAAGLFKYDKYISLTGSGINLIISFVFGKSIGMAGILLGTSATYFIQFILNVILFYGSFLKMNCIGIFLRNIVFAAITAAECMLIGALTNMIGAAIANPYIEFIAFAAVSASVPLVINSVIFIKTDEFNYSIKLGTEMIKNKN